MDRLIQKLTGVVGALLIIFTGLFFILMVDLYLSASSTTLFVGIILALLSGILFVLSENFKKKAYLFYGFKALGLIFGILFISFLFRFMHHDDELMKSYAQELLRDDDALSFIESFKYDMWKCWNKEPVLKLFKYSGKDYNNITGKISFLNKSYNDGLAISFKYTPWHYAFIGLSMLACGLQVSNITLNIINGIDQD